jgi:tetratricopeptide (TPR) repeat protein
MRRLGREAEDIRAALRRCADGHDVDTGLRLASATWRYWQASGELAEARHRLDLMLAVPGATDAARANALDAAAGLAYWQADYRAAQADYEHALALYRAAGDRDHEADTLYGLSMTATWGGDPASGARLALEARTIFEELGLRSKVGETSMAQGFALWQERRYDDARPLWEDALAISREEGADTLAVTQLAGIAGLEFHMGAHADALRIALDALDEACDLENVALCVWLLDFVAAFAVRSEPAAAVRIAAAAEAQRRASGGGLTVQDLHITPAREAARRSLGRMACEAAWAEGREMDLEDAVSAARSLRLVSVG